MTYNDIKELILTAAKQPGNYEEMCDIIQELKNILNDYDPIKLDVYNQVMLLTDKLNKKEIGLLLGLLKKVKKDLDNVFDNVE